MKLIIEAEISDVKIKKLEEMRYDVNHPFATTVALDYGDKVIYSGGEISSLNFRDTNKTAKDFIKDNAVDEGFLQDWYQNSVLETDTPIWTDEHIAEVAGDFYLIPKEIIDGRKNT